MPVVRFDVLAALVRVVQILREVICKMHHTIHAIDQTAMKLHTFLRPHSQVNVPATIATSHVMIGLGSDRFLLGVQLHGHVVVPHVGQPFHNIATTVAARYTGSAAH